MLRYYMFILVGAVRAEKMPSSKDCADECSIKFLKKMISFVHSNFVFDQLLGLTNDEAKILFS